MKSRETIQKNAVDALIKNGGGTIEVATGIGKSKILIDYLLKTALPYNTILLTVPLTVLIDNWIKEFQKWTNCDVLGDLITVVVPNGYITVLLKTIQSAYKNVEHVDYLVLDEIHTSVTEEYSAIFTNTRYRFCIGLTATTDIERRDDKREVYEKYCPIVYEYHEGEDDGIVNKTQLVIIEHELNDLFKTKAGSFKKHWMVGEKQQYDYLSKQIKQGQILMASEGSSNFFEDASEWFWRKNGTKGQLEAGRKYLGAITARRKFLLNLNSTAEIAKRTAKKIILENDFNKVLVFSEQVEQLKKICKFNVYGEQSQELNDQMINGFNDGEIRALGSCYSLTLGMNMVGANNAILESYQGSNTKATQRIGRLHRLQTDEVAHIYVIKVLGTQSEKWFNEMLSEYDLSDAKVIKSMEVLK